MTKPSCGGPEGIRRARTIRRRPEEEKYNKEELLGVTGTPLQPNPGEGDQRIRTRMEMHLRNLSSRLFPV